MRLVLSEAAETDLRDIFRYTRRAFGERQAARCGAALDAKMLAAKAPQLGRRFDEVDDDIRRVASGSHHVYFHVVGDAVRIIRILHERMDERLHL